MQKLSKGLMLPIAILPIAGLFLGIGAGIENILIQAGSTSNGAYVFANVLKQTGDIVFANLPILFAVAVAIAFTDDAGVAGLSAVLAWAVMNGTQQIFINDISVAEGFDKGTIYSILFYSRVPGSVVTQNIGITSMQTSVFGGIIVGLTVAGLYNKFKTTQLPAILGFFSGTRFVLIVTFLTSILLGFGFLML
ncbi:MAG: hypothetical protein DRP42_02035 [Tenericutes bacterium]|nr:MAG: hypothetical protein DRP42_02035 [Mycoplasmatota bacterium]